MKRVLFDEEHDQFRQSFRRWLGLEIVPREVFAEAGALGFLGMAVPPECSDIEIDAR
jgi:alkylation response protein AidB-like acyl-CoA dehydrogenase